MGRHKRTSRIVCKLDSGRALQNTSRAGNLDCPSRLNDSARKHERSLIAWKQRREKRIAQNMIAIHQRWRNGIPGNCVVIYAILPFVILSAIEPPTESYKFGTTACAKCASFCSQP